MTGTARGGFPVTAGAFQTAVGDSSTHGFVAKLDATGSTLVYSTYLAGNDVDSPNAIAVDGAGVAYVTGYTLGGFPTTAGAFQTAYGGGGADGFALKLNAAGSALVYSTYLGGTGADNAVAIAIDGDGNAFVAGYARNGTFPTTAGAFQTAYGGGDADVFVSKLNPDGSALVTSTFIGGSGEDTPAGIAIDGSGSVYVAGYTTGGFQTTAGAYQPAHGGGDNDVFVARLNAAGNALVFATYLGGGGDDYANAVALDGSGNVHIAGFAGAGFPITGDAYQAVHGGGEFDAFVSALDPTGAVLRYSTYLGGAGDDYARIALDRGGNVYVAGSTGSVGFPTTSGAVQTTFGGGTSDAFVVKLPAIFGPASNYQGLWWRSPASSESGWGINFAHQGDTIFATWFTYDAQGKPLWFAALLKMTAPGVYAGDVFTTTGPPFNAVPFDPGMVIETVVGTMTVSFSDADNAEFSYTIDIASPAKLAVSQTKTITRQQFATPVPTCAHGVQSSLGLATNFQDLWWASPPGSESGWGVNFTHQGNTIFVTWFTYGADGKPLWLIAVAERTAPNVYEGQVLTVTGPAFSAEPWDPAQVTETVVGTTTLTFSDGNHATFAYTVSGISQTKEITRQVFVDPGTVCQ